MKVKQVMNLSFFFNSKTLKVDESFTGSGARNLSVEVRKILQSL